MSNFRIFTESKADVKFIRDYIAEIFNLELSDDDFDTLGSWSGYKAGGNLKASIKENHADQKQTILVLDADADFANRQQEVLNDFSGYGIPIKLFLFPDNNSTGNIEILLCKIAIHQKIIDCFDSYEKCIDGFESPVIKSKVFAYLDALLPSSQKKGDSKDLIQEKNRNYRNPNHWDLAHDSLTPFKIFIQSFITP